MTYSQFLREAKLKHTRRIYLVWYLYYASLIFPNTECLTWQE